ncbi:MAG: carbohydrate ABC transporter permease [Lachnospiraceae bacterium]|nr:carbohydrate ABC transporter permease [Lachnospiraceae bacterium]
MFRKVINTIIESIIKIIFIAAGIIICAPVLLVITGSVMGSGDLYECLAPVFLDGQGFVTWKLIPQYPTLEHYKKLLFQSPRFFVLFWNSIKIVGLILIGQLLIGVPAAWAFAVYNVKGKNILFTLYIVLMLLPFQVTMLSSYIVLDRLSLLNTHWAVILPAVFNTFPIFVIYGGFRAIPRPLLEAARIDGAGELYLFVRIGLTLGKGSIMSAIVLGFLEYWNMIEQPIAFLEDKSLWPLSLYLPQISWTQAGFAFSASVIMLIPAVFVFIMGQDYLEQGIIYSGLKM